jgi:hypothetical protein
MGRLFAQLRKIAQLSALSLWAVAERRGAAGFSAPRGEPCHIIIIARIASPLASTSSSSIASHRPHRASSASRRLSWAADAGGDRLSQALGVAGIGSIWKPSRDAAIKKTPLEI